MRQNGFSLIELVVSMGILAILATLAVAGYSSFTMRANRTDATKTLTLDAQALERCYSQSFTYAGCAAAPAGSATTPQGYYTVTIAVATTPTASYTLSAVAANPPQTSDSACQTFTLNNAGTQGAATSDGVANTSTCWGS